MSIEGIASIGSKVGKCTTDTIAVLRSPAMATVGIRHHL